MYNSHSPESCLLTTRVETQQLTKVINPYRMYLDLLYVELSSVLYSRYETLHLSMSVKTIKRHVFAWQCIRVHLWHIINNNSF